ncbi:MAG: hypothetical protein HYT97_02690 [Elusimicrobia bacterium]|nr:hypothetical protein [Elusimicrobiota bacterium]
MIKRIIFGIILLAMAGWPLVAADMKHDADFCTKHCNAMQLSKEVKTLEKEIAAEKASLKAGSSEKAASLIAKKEKVKKHIGQHEAELSDLKTKLEALESELK